MSVKVSEPGFSLDYFTPDQFHVVTGLTCEVRGVPRDVDEGFGLTKGQRITVEGIGLGVVEGIATEDGVPQPFVRMRGRLHHISKVKTVG